MGFFSQDCHYCGHPALSPYSVEALNAWMTRVVTISPSGDLHVGDYDGYGSVGGAEYAIGDQATVYHEACWARLGKPMEYQGASPSSSDQGYFFDDGVHNWANPDEARAHENPEAPWRREVTQ